MNLRYPIAPACLVFALCLSFGKAEELGSAKEAARLLTSRSRREQEQGVDVLRKSSDALIASTLKEMESGDFERKTEAAKVLRILISPWARSGQGRYLFRPQRRVGRPLDHPKAAEIRKALLRELQKICQEPHKAPKSQTEYSEMLSMEVTVEWICLSLEEVADREAAAQLVNLMKDERDRDRAVHMMEVVELVYALPAGYRRRVLMCGNMSEGESARYHAEEDRKCAESKEDLQVWHQTYAKASQQEYLEAALVRWDKRLQDSDFANQNYYRRWEGMGLKLDPLVRTGEAILPFANARKAKAQDSIIKGNWEMVIATITGQVDEGFVHALFAGGDPERAMACFIVASAGSKAWREELDRLANEGDFTAKETVKELESWPE